MELTDFTLDSALKHFGIQWRRRPIKNHDRSVWFDMKTCTVNTREPVVSRERHNDLKILKVALCEPDRMDVFPPKQEIQKIKVVIRVL